MLQPALSSISNEESMSLDQLYGRNRRSLEEGEGDEEEGEDEGEEDNDDDNDDRGGSL